MRAEKSKFVPRKRQGEQGMWTVINGIAVRRYLGRRKSVRSELDEERAPGLARTDQEALLSPDPRCQSPPRSNAGSVGYERLRPVTDTPSKWDKHGIENLGLRWALH